MKRIMAIYDTDPLYAARLAEVINQKERIPFAVMAFSSLERLQRFSEETGIELLLISSQSDREKIKNLGIKKIISLSDGDSVKTEEKITSIYKYQSSDNIIREVMACYCDDLEEDVSVSGKVRANVIGVYSPVGRCLKTSLALTIGQVLSHESRALYITLEEYSGLPVLTGEEYREDLSDLMYYYNQGTYNMLRLNSVIHSMGGLDYIPPARYPEDLAHMSAPQMAEMLKWIVSEGGYEVIVLDAGNYGRRVFPLLEICSVVYMPVEEDSVSKAKIEEFFYHMESAGCGDLKSRIKKIKLPRPSRPLKGENYLEQLLWGELGDYVRQLLKGGIRP